MTVQLYRNVRIMIIVIVVYILVAAVRGNKLIAKATPSEVENTVKLWLQYVADCGGGWHARPAASNHDGTDTDVSD